MNIRKTAEVLGRLDALQTRFQTLAEVVNYLEAQKFERVFENTDNISVRDWISHDGLINAEVIGLDTCYQVEYKA